MPLKLFKHITFLYPTTFSPSDWYSETRTKHLSPIGGEREDLLHGVIRL